MDHLSGVVKPWLSYGYRPVHVEKAKTHRRALKLLVEAVGETPMRVWLALCGLRDRVTGLAHPSAAGLARKLGLARRTVQRALKRLWRIGLVFSAGKRYVERAGRRVWCRWVWGELDGEHVHLPKWTARRIRAAMPDLEADDLALHPIPTAMLRKKLGKAAELWRLLYRARGRHDVCPLRDADLAGRLGAGLRSVQRWAAKLREAGLVRPAPGGGRLVLGIPDKVTSKIPASAADRIRWSADANSWGGKRQVAVRVSHRYQGKEPYRYSAFPPSGGSQNTRAHAREEILKEMPDSKWEWYQDLVRNRVIPRVPIIAKNPPANGIPMVVVPLPRKLDPGAPVDTNAGILAEAYRRFASRVLGKKSWAFARGELKNSKHYGVLKAWVEYMLTEVKPESRISPLVWLAFRQSQWKMSPRSKKQPLMGPQYAFQLEALAKPSNRGWCRREMEQTYRIQPGLTRRSKELVHLEELHSKLRSAIVRAPKWATTGHVRKLVEKLFPDDLHPVLVQAARIGQQKLQEKINRRVASGDLSVYTGGK